MKIYCYDNDPSEGELNKNQLSPTHYATITVDYEYQAEQWAIDIGEDYPSIVRIEVPDLNRQWNRKGSEMVELTREILES